MTKQIILARLFDSGGSNNHLATLIQYLGPENVILVLESEAELAYLSKIPGSQKATIRVMKNLHGYAHLQYRLTTNIKEFLKLIFSAFRVFLLCVRYGFAGITISAVEPEKYLYFFWLPFVRVTYILHTEPDLHYTPVTPASCNRRLGNKKIIITVSEWMKKAIVERWQINSNNSEYIFIIHNCVQQSGNTENMGTHLGNAPLIVITLGHVADRKNPAVWLQVAQAVSARYTAVQFLWLGNGAELDKYQKLTASTPNVRFLGLIDDVQSYLSKAAVYYQPSITEPHGIAVVEAMAHHLPCVVSNLGGLTESVKEKYNGFWVEPKNVAEHVSAIVELLNNPDLRRSCGDNSYKRYNELFTYEAFKRKMDLVYAN